MKRYVMGKILKRASELETILLAKLRESPNCEGAASVSLYRLADGRSADTNWTVAGFNPGTSGRARCETALNEIESRLHEFYELAPLRWCRRWGGWN